MSSHEEVSNHKEWPLLRVSSEERPIEIIHNQDIYLWTSLRMVDMQVSSLPDDCVIVEQIVQLSNFVIQGSKDIQFSRKSNPISFQLIHQRRFKFIE